MWIKDNGLINRPARWCMVRLFVDLLKMSHNLLHFFLRREDVSLTGAELEPFLSDLWCITLQDLMNGCHGTAAVPGLHNERIKVLLLPESAKLAKLLGLPSAMYSLLPCSKQHRRC